MWSKIFNHQNLARFKERINRFENRDSFETDCLLLACDTLALYETFPMLLFTEIFSGAKEIQLMTIMMRTIMKEPSQWKSMFRSAQMIKEYCFRLYLIPLIQNFRNVRK